MKVLNSRFYDLEERLFYSIKYWSYLGSAENETDNVPLSREGALRLRW